MESSARSRALDEEQNFVTTAYSALDREREYYEWQLARVRAQGGSGTPGARRERDSFATHYEDNLIRLRNLENRLVLGRLDYDNGASNHIGRMTLRGDSDAIILLDWRAPQSQPFYSATALNPQGVVRRRHISTRLREVTGVEDELLGEDSTNSLNLTGEGALFAAMNKARDGKMGDIVATIQAEQDRIIRADAQGILVVQGGPGTGKTAVALHRAAYLLYTHRERLAKSGVLIIGPSTQFLRYIDQVLPSLGETDVVSTTIESLLPGVSVTATEPAEMAEIKGRSVWAKIAQRAVRNVLEKPMTAVAKFRINGHKLELTPTMVQRAQAKARSTQKLHNAARETYAMALVRELARQLAQAEELELNDNEWLIGDVASSIDARREVNRYWLPSSPESILERLYAFPELLATAAPELSEYERALLRRPKGSGWTSADIAILDELAELLGPLLTDEERRQRAAVEASEREMAAYVASTMNQMSLGGGIVSSRKLIDHLDDSGSTDTLAERAGADRTWTYGHVVVDEAQELSAMQWRMVARRNPAKSMTIVGDLDQHPAGSPEGGWGTVLGTLGDYHREEVLTVSYRTPATILDRAQRAMAELGHPVRKVIAARDLPDSYHRHIVGDDEIISALESLVARRLMDLDAEYGNGLGTLAVIASSQDLDKYRETLFHQRGEENLGRLSVVTPTASKGLEYDAVIVVSPSHIENGGPGDLYVALTRATRWLDVLSTDGLIPSLDD